eukprot:TRINITY_DN6527_c0_g1_i1.p1 TRINITY_DN6527_c0_g1~~TRINITY_DN6527_c0_g1_i1.p1  ORF type:complete len:242 (+),score=76.14 TRINITY_DN6527_c0_g1_i1:96-821(+)
MVNKLPPLKNGKKQSELDSCPVLLEKERRIKDLEAEVKKCDGVIQKYQKAELKRQRKKAPKGISSSAEKDLVERVFYTEVQKRSEKLDSLREQLAAKPLSNTLSAGDLEDAVGRLYDEALNRRAEFEAKRRLEHTQPTSPTRTIRPDEVSDIATRLCNTEIERRQQKLDYLMKKHLPVSPKRTKFAKEQQSSSNERLYNKPIQHHTKVIDALRSQYVPAPQQNKLTKEKQAEVANRLCVTK